MTVDIIKVEDFSCPVCGSPDFFAVFDKPKTAEEEKTNLTHYGCSGCTFVFMNSIEFGKRNINTKNKIN
ncbi:MAG: hypothetical protein PHZ26_06110 [Candidatus Gracilibacteria bacterium]|nr:hypothetical protein [Candidatus Gracilibacteria bacterium]